ncbi:hybrid sensor histidine kinase/response regulator [Pannonibacter sp. Pt2]|uniref:histidine kinase n=1 Tax=Pannonibacter anstelovis TaxID=3121537 RepID=A0ABU7ZM47_9HYPH
MTGKEKGSPESQRLALMAHDLRTPLNAMRLTAELIGMEPLSPLQQVRLATLIAAIDGLAEMTSGVLNEGRAAAGLAPLPQPARAAQEGADAGRMVLEIAGLFEPLAKAKGLPLAVSVPEAPLFCPPELQMALRRAATVLLDNAIRYTPRGQVRAVLREEAGTLLLEITDTGPGIGVMERRRLFRPFTRGTAGRAGDGSSSGLGLWGAAEVVKAAGGRLDLDDAPGGGCRFSVHLPLPGGGGASGSGSAQPGPHVLIVDDNETNRRLLAALLESFAMTSDAAGTGQQAVNMAAATAYDGVLLDLHMPGMDGMETAAALRLGPDGARLPLIAVTAALESVGDRKLRQAGFDDVLPKPISPSQLYQTLNLARTRHKLRLEEMAG